MFTGGTPMDGLRVSMSNPSMTIKVAQEFFHKYGDDTEGIYDEIYRTLASKDCTELANDNYLDALQLTSLMIRKTKSSFRMLTGTTAEAFIGHLTDHFAAMIQRLHLSGKKAHVIVVNADKQCEMLDSLAKKYQGTLTVEYASVQDDVEVSHFIVADNMVRAEKPHPQLTAETPANIIQARVLFNNRGAASVYESHFDSLTKILNSKAAAKI